MKKTYITGLILLAVAVAGCSQLQSSPPAQASLLARPGLPAIPLQSITPTTQLEAGEELSPLIKSILTPSAQSVANEEPGNTSLELEEEPAPISPTPTATDSPPITTIQLRTATPVPTPVRVDDDSASVLSTATPLTTPVSSGIPDLLLSSGSSVLGVGDSLDIRLLLTSAPTGVSGFIVELEIVNTAVAEITTSEFPNFALGTASALPAALTKLQAVDLSQEVNASPNEVVLAIAGIRGIATGTTEIRALVIRIDDDNGLPINPNTQSFTLTIQ